MALYVVATPIGNLEDITLRALRILREVDLILAEDTRVTKKLLSHYEIQNKQLMTYNEERSGVESSRVIELLREGKDLALVTDAGTPGISDPGARLVKEVREALPETPIVSVPGPSAVTAALSVAGVSEQEFLFLGFPPHKKGRQTFFNQIRDTEVPVVFYESTHRIMKALDSLREVLLGNGRVIVVREITKVYEEVISGSSEEVRLELENNPVKQKGEFVVIVSK